MNHTHKTFLVLALCFLNAFAFSQNEVEAQEEKKFQEVVVTDSVSAANLMKRAVQWVKTDSKRFQKTNGVATGTKAECVAKFRIKAKELNPVADFTGIIEMHVSIDCKDNKYRYTISKIKHTSANGKASGGAIENIVPECGSMTMPDNTWRKIKGEAFKNASMVISELKEGMMQNPTDSKDEW
jgi:hypothetical protein